MECPYFYILVRRVRLTGEPRSIGTVTKELRLIFSRVAFAQQKVAIEERDKKNADGRLAMSYFLFFSSSAIVFSRSHSGRIICRLSISSAGDIVYQYRLAQFAV